MSQPVAPVPDTKDWTWTTARVCPECGYDAATVDRGDVPALTRSYAAALADRLHGDAPAARPSPEVWSPLEYAAHVRDVCTLYDERLALILAEDDPLFANWDQDATALEQRYWAQDPATVAADLRGAADAVASRFAAVPADAWTRTARRSDGATFTVDTFARYFLHDLAHHAWDVRPR